MKKIVAVILHEVRLMLAPTIFFFVCFNMLVLTIAFMDPVRGFSIASHSAATVGALIVGKAVLIADKLPFFNRYPHKPLIYNTLWKAALYIAITMLIRIAEALLSAATNEYGFATGVAEEAAHFTWGRFAAIQMWLAILFLVYTGFRELANQIGPQRMREMFFTAPERGS